MYNMYLFTYLNIYYFPHLNLIRYVSNFHKIWMTSMLMM
uniref:Uncharacterized protein n=1 Tax=Anguilla anguilla TaxID=7936 RepID=A0A0E9WAL1_ANGAN